MAKKETTGTVPTLHAPIVRIDPETGEEIWVSSGVDALGREMPDPVPFAPEVAMGKQQTLADTVFHMLHHARLRQIADEQGFDTEEEANDFEIEDEPLAPGVTLFEAWAKLAELGVADPAPVAPADATRQTPPSSVPGTQGSGAEGGGSPAPPPTPAPSDGPAKVS